MTITLGDTSYTKPKNYYDPYQGYTLCVLSTDWDHPYWFHHETQTSTWAEKLL